LRRLLDGDTVTFAGDHYHLAEQRCDPRPVQEHVPLLVGGAGMRVLSIGARHADAVGFTGLGRTLPDGQRHDPSGFSPARVDHDVAAVRATAGERLDRLELQVLVPAVVVTDNPRSAAEAIAAGRLPSLAADDVLATPYLMVGTTSGLVERLLAQRERWGLSHYTVRPEALGHIEPVIAALRGH
jgi:alkanesulfonate monooxygenase SsuD/methylene tetrahydromethanopterin reductase-like flavin-dependent oxidoreductase (luciferase family)